MALAAVLALIFWACFFRSGGVTAADPNASQEPPAQSEEPAQTEEPIQSQEPTGIENLFMELSGTGADGNEWLKSRAILLNDGTWTVEFDYDAENSHIQTDNGTWTENEDGSLALTGMIGNVWLVVGMMCFLMIATLTTNIAANALTPAVAIVHLTGGRLNFKWAAIALGVLGVAIRPWVLINDMGVYMNFFLNGGGALLGPIIGITICHYFFVCRTELDLRSLYVPEGEAMFENLDRKSVV